MSQSLSVVPVPKESAGAAPVPAPGSREPVAQTAADLMRHAPAVESSSRNRDVFAVFEAHPDLVGLAVVEADRPIGLINRNIFMQSMARPFHREIYLNKSCIAFMDKEPLIVEAGLPLQDLSFQVIRGGAKALADGFVVAKNGCHAGVGLANDVFAAIAALQAERSRQVMESIDYASVIQSSLSRASREGMRQNLPDHFLLWEPRDVVSGDFYFFQSWQDGWLLALFDCTGHGVPGAFMTLIMSSFLQGAVSGGKQRDPAALLADMNRRVKLAMGQVDHSHSEEGAASDDGMDAAFCWYDRPSRHLTYAGAHMPLFLLAPGAEEVRIVDGDRQGVGYATTPLDQAWTNHRLEVAPDSHLYLFSDGFLDQVGGEKRIAFGKRRLCARLLDARKNCSSMPAQRNALLTALREFQGNEARRDDVSAIGIHFHSGN